LGFYEYKIFNWRNGEPGILMKGCSMSFALNSDAPFKASMAGAKGAPHQIAGHETGLWNYC
jgi:hypothetical protein